MTIKHLSHDELHTLIKDSGIADSHPGLAIMILTGQTVFETGGVSYALRSSHAANLTREAPSTAARAAATTPTAPRLTGDEADKRVEEFERARLARAGGQQVPPRARAPEPAAEAADASDELLSLVRNNVTRAEQLERSHEPDPLAHLFDGPDAA